MSGNLGVYDARMCTADIHHFTGVSLAMFARGDTTRHCVDQ